MIEEIRKQYQNLKDDVIYRSRPSPSAPSQKQESEQQTNQQETVSDDAQSSQTHEQENRQKQTTKPFKEKSLAAKIRTFLKLIWEVIMLSIIVIVSRRIFPIISGFFSGVLSGVFFFLAIDWMIKSVSGWSPWDEKVSDRFFSIQTDIVSFIVTFFSRIIGTILAKNRGKRSDIFFKGWFIYTAVGVCFGGIGGIVLGLPVAVIWADEAIISRIAAFIGAFVSALLACRYLNENEQFWRRKR